MKFYIHILLVLWNTFEYESFNVFRSGNNTVILPTDMYFRSSQHGLLKFISDNQATHIRVSKSGNDELNVFGKNGGFG